MKGEGIRKMKYAATGKTAVTVKFHLFVGKHTYHSDISFHAWKSNYGK
jgi:hypothetical protein